MGVTVSETFSRASAGQEDTLRRDDEKSVPGVNCLLKE